MKEKNSFSGSIGFVLAAAGSAVGVGNIWRFPYLCAKDGGGLFLLVYLVLVLTFGFVLLTTDVAIGRKTKKNALKAFGALNKALGLSRLSDVSCADSDYDVLFRHRRMDHEIFCVVCRIGWKCARGGRIFYFLHHFQSSSDRLYAHFPCADRMDRLSRRRKRH